MLQRQFLKSGFPEFAQRVVVDTVPYTTFFGGASQYNGIEKALPALKSKILYFRSEASGATISNFHRKPFYDSFETVL